MKYSDNVYKEAIVALIDDIHYSNASYSSKVANIRKYAEIIVRRLLNYDTSKQLTLGHKYTQEKLTKKGCTEKLFIDALTAINNIGSDRTHTQVIPVATKEEYDNAVTQLFDLYAYLFVDYFKNNTFGSNKDILQAFSILPVEIRYSALLCLYSLFPNNTSIIDKLVLATAKAKGVEFCIEWIEEHKTELEKITPEFTSADYLEYIEQYGVVSAINIAKMMTKNMYDISIDKANSTGSNYVPLYKNMEEALACYNQHGIVVGTSQEIIDFNNLMHFVYLGRKEKIKEITETEA